MVMYFIEIYVEIVMTVNMSCLVPTECLFSVACVFLHVFDVFTYVLYYLKCFSLWFSLPSYKQRKMADFILSLVLFGTCLRLWECILTMNPYNLQIKKSSLSTLRTYSITYQNNTVSSLSAAKLSKRSVGKA